MLRFAADYFKSIPPVFIDGLLYCLIALFTFTQGYLSGDESKKFISDFARFWVLFGVGGMATVTGALKMFRSTSYSEHQENKKLEETK